MTNIMTIFYQFLKTAEVSLKTLTPQNLEVEKYNLNKIKDVRELSQK